MKIIMIRLLLLPKRILLALLLFQQYYSGLGVSAFFATSHNNGVGRSIIKCSRLYGIAEWRLQQGTSSTHKNGNNSNDTKSTIAFPSTSVLLLPFSPSEALFPGQCSGTIVLKEGRWFDLLDEAMEDPHAEVIGTILMGPDGLLPILPLCEITHYELSAGYRGKVTATIQLQGVGRAKLTQLEQMKPFMKGQVQEIFDQHDDNDDNEGTLGWEQRTMQDLESLLKECGRYDDYQIAYRSALRNLGGKQQETTFSPSSSSTSSSGYTSCERGDVMKRLEAASWAATIVGLRPMENASIEKSDDDIIILPSLDGSSCSSTLRYRALSTIHVKDRLDLVMSRLLKDTSFQ